MPELPEVETSRRGIAPHIVGATVSSVIIRERRLRWPVSESVDQGLPGATVTSVGRRAKYLLINTTQGTAIIHLGMSGSVTIVDNGTPAGVHDHVDIEFDSGRSLRFRDPRRFGSLHWSTSPHEHSLIRNLGPEPLSKDFDGHYLWARSRGRRVAIKQFIMNAQIVVGVGNIYASETCFLAGIRPRRAARRLTRAECHRVADATRTILGRAIAAGGTTPFVLGAVDLAGQAGAMTALLTCTPPATATACDHLIVLDTGPELLTGSTRLKAGSATKLALNIISTTLFVRLGKVYSNLMVDMRATNTKLADRAIRILCELKPELTREAASGILHDAGGELKAAIVMARLGVDLAAARAKLAEHGERLRPIL